MPLNNSSKEKLEQKLGEALGLEMAAQKAVYEQNKSPNGIF
jgi:hypothetical protein